MDMRKAAHEPIDSVVCVCAHARKDLLVVSPTRVHPVTPYCLHA